MTAISPRTLRPAKVHRALRRRHFERELARTPLHELPGLLDLGTVYGGWTMPTELIGDGWTCYSVGAGGDVSFDLELIRRFGATVRAFDPVAEYVESASAAGADEPRYSVRQAAIATSDGPLRMQITHDVASSSVSSAGLYESHSFIELPGRTLPSLMAELGDERIDLLKLDVEGSEYELIPTFDLHAMGVKIFATQLHHTGSVAEARELLALLEREDFVPVACRPLVKLAFARRDLL